MTIQPALTYTKSDNLQLENKSDKQKLSNK